MDDERNQKKESLLDESGLGGHELLKSQLVENKELENIEEEVFYELDAERSINLVGGNGTFPYFHIPTFPLYPLPHQ
jgi:hypothetical protein